MGPNGCKVILRPAFQETDMKKIVNRIIQCILTMFIVSIICFALVKAAPGDPVMTYVEPNMSEEYIANLRESLGLTKPMWEQYALWLGRILQGNFGNSLMNSRPVLTQILERLPATMILMGTSMVLGFVIALFLGLYSGKNKNGILDKIVSFFCFVGISIPTFWFGIMLIVLLSLQLHLLPSSGIRTTGVDSLWDLISHGIMPVLVLSIGKISIYTRYVRAETIKQMSEDYVLSAIAKGASRGYILFHHVLKNCLLPVITLVGMNMASLVSGSYIVESLFGWPGLGTTGMSAIYSRDYNLIMGTTMLSCIILILGNFAADLLYTVADPRIKTSGGKRA